VSADTDALHLAVAMLQTATIEGWLEELVPHIENATGRNFTDRDRNVMRGAVDRARTLYIALKHTTIDWPAQNTYTLHEILEPAKRVIELLEDDANYGGVIVALAKPDEKSVKPAARRHEVLLDFLKMIVRNAPPQSPNPAHRPSKTKHLRAAADALVDYWEYATGERFTQDWHRGAPLEDGGDDHRRLLPNTPGAQFVYEAMKLIDPECLDQLPGVTAAIRRARRRTLDK
jgi:hypothetical protein